jgi:hypothetical protein
MITLTVSIILMAILIVAVMAVAIAPNRQHVKVRSNNMTTAGNTLRRDEIWHQ